jgi:hypothetical protein
MHFYAYCLSSLYNLMCTMSCNYKHLLVPITVLYLSWKSTYSNLYRSCHNRKYTCKLLTANSSIITIILMRLLESSIQRKQPVKGTWGGKCPVRQGFASWTLWIQFHSSYIFSLKLVSSFTVWHKLMIWVSDIEYVTEWVRNWACWCQKRSMWVPKLSVWVKI